MKMKTNMARGGRLSRPLDPPLKALITLTVRVCDKIQNSFELICRRLRDRKETQVNGELKNSFCPCHSCMSLILFTAGGLCMAFHSLGNQLDTPFIFSRLWWHTNQSAECFQQIFKIHQQTLLCWSKHFQMKDYRTRMSLYPPLISLNLVYNIS